MLIKIDLKSITDLIESKLNEVLDKRFGEFAILMQKEFRAIHEEFDNVNAILETKADKSDISRLENKFEGRIEKLDDNMRIVKTKLKLS